MCLGLVSIFHVFYSFYHKNGYKYIMHNLDKTIENMLDFLFKIGTFKVELLKECQQISFLINLNY